MSEAKAIKSKVPKIRFTRDDGSPFPDWELDRLESFCSQLNGIPVDGNEIVEETNENPLLRGINITEGLIRHSYEIDRYHAGDVSKLDKYRVKFGDVVIGMDGSKVGKNIAIIGNKEVGSILIQRVACLRSKFPNDLRFVYQHLISDHFRNYVARINTSSGIPHISARQINEFQILRPHPDEQKKIAEFLGAVDEKIAKLKKKKALLADYKRGVMQKLFAQKIRFTRDDGSPFPDWEEKKINELFTVTRGNVLAMTLVSDIQTIDMPYPVYSSQTKNNGLAGYYNQFLFENCITWTTDGANAGDTKYRSGKFYCTNVCGVLISNKGYANTFMAELINSVSEKYVSYVGNPKLMNGVMGAIILKVPHPDEQKEIADFLSAIDQKIEAVATQITQTEAFKKGLLQQMFV